MPQVEALLPHSQPLSLSLGPLCGSLNLPDLEPTPAQLSEFSEAMYLTFGLPVRSGAPKGPMGPQGPQLDVHRRVRPRRQLALWDSFSDRTNPSRESTTSTGI